MSTLFFIENPLLDIQVQDKDKALINKYELPVGGACLANEAQQALYPEILQMEGVELIPGGSALNSTRATNYMLNHQGHEEKCVYFGSISDDKYGQILENALTEKKIHGNFYKGSGIQTGTCGVVVHDNERALCANLSAACKYSTEHLESNMDALKNAKLIYTTAFFITSNNEAL
jgi:adenosine kinase